MLQLVVSDSSCLIDLRKGGLLFTDLLLPYRFVVVLPLVESELHGFTKADWEELKVRGLNVVDLEASQVQRAFELKRSTPCCRHTTALVWHLRNPTRAPSC